MNQELAGRAKQFAAESGRTFTELVEEAVDLFIKHPAPRQAPVQPPVYDSGVRLTEKDTQRWLEQSEDSEDDYLTAKLFGVKEEYLALHQQPTPERTGA